MESKDTTTPDAATILAELQQANAQSQDKLLEAVAGHLATLYGYLAAQGQQQLTDRQANQEEFERLNTGLLQQDQRNTALNDKINTVEDKLDKRVDALEAATAENRITLNVGELRDMVAAAAGGGAFPIPANG